MDKSQSNAAQGTPAQWTTNRRGEKFYTQLNKYGEHMWMVDITMDCSQTDGGFFYVKGVTERGEWEPGQLNVRCRGGGRPPRSSGDNNHWAVCGKVNVFYWGQRGCTVASLPEEPTQGGQGGQGSVEDWQRTVIFIQRGTSHGQEVFLRGGYSQQGLTDHRIPIRHNELEVAGDIPQHKTWVEGDMFLDWNGRERGQRPYRDRRNTLKIAQGTPAQWTSRDSSNTFHSPLNRYGDHMWMVDITIDCSKTENGLFHVKGVTENGQWESGQLGGRCRGGPAVPRRSGNHWAVCGKVNVFYWGQSRCTIEDLP